MFGLPYGKGLLHVPDLWGPEAILLQPGPFPPDPGISPVNQALDNPVGAPPLETLCRPGKRVAVVVPDLTRRASVHAYLPALLERIGDAGVDSADVTIVIALGIHRALEDKEIRFLVGDRVSSLYRVVNHRPDDESFNIHLGGTDAGIPVEIGAPVARADLVVLTGGITFHYFAGYGGGRKSLLPGVASRRACEAHHRMVVQWRRGRLKGTLAPGVLQDNPIHQQMLQACAMVPAIFTLNVVTDPAGRIVAASAGNLDMAHREACRKHDRFYRKTLPSGPSRLVLASAGGYPKDVNFVQAHKGLLSAHAAAAPDGVVILAAQCSEGTGHPDFLDWFRRCHTEERWLSDLESRYQINGQTAFSAWLRARAVPTALLSTLNPSDVRCMGMVPVPDGEQALHWAREVLGDLPPPVILPDAGDTLAETGRTSAECRV